METRLVGGLTLSFDAAEREAAEIIGRACEKSVPLIHECWGLPTPVDCRVYVMTSWLLPVLRSASWQWQILLALTLPLWGFRARQMWPYAGGWAQQLGKRRTVGLKPPRLLAASDRSIGARIFVPEEDLNARVQQNTCHELVHAFAAHLRLPMWLNEGLAMVTVDRFAGHPTVRQETIDTLDRPPHDTRPGTYRQVRAADKETLVYHSVRGYWLTRYLQDTRPELLRSLLAQRVSHRVLEDRVAAAYSMGYEAFWRRIDGITASHFEPRAATDT